MNRGNVILSALPAPFWTAREERPAVVVQSDAYTGAVSTLVVAEVTTNVKKTPERSQWNSMFNSRFQKG